MSLSNTLAPAQYSKDPWALARRRARVYLSLHHLPEATCEQVLAQAAAQLPAKPPKAEAEQIQIFIQHAQKVTQTLIGCTYPEPMPVAANGRMSTWTARKTGPRVERSSIKVAALQAISLRLNPNRHAKAQI